MFQFPRFPPPCRGTRPSRRVGCPIRRSLDRRLPAPPQSISSRGHVLHRRPAPRHPPCAHHSGRTLRAAPSSSPRSPPGHRDKPGTSLLVWCLMCFVLRPTQDTSTKRLVPLLPSRWSRMGRFPSSLNCQGAQTAGGAAGARTPNLRRARAALSQLSYDPRTGPVGAPGLEPGTSALSGPRSNQLSYAPAHVAACGTGCHRTPPSRRPKMEDTRSPCRTGAEARLRKGEGDPTRPWAQLVDDTRPIPSLPIRRHCPALPVSANGNERCVARCPDDQVIGDRPDLGCSIRRWRHSLERR